MKRIYDSNLKMMVAIDGEFEMELGMCYAYIKNWKRLFCRKNSKLNVSIRLRCFFPDPNPDFWKFYLELERKDKMVEQHRICHEAYEVLARDKEESQYGNVSFTNLFEFKPATGSGE